MMCLVPAALALKFEYAHGHGKCISNYMYFETFKKDFAANMAACSKSGY
jgi:hypothetical protein